MKAMKKPIMILAICLLIAFAMLLFVACDGFKINQNPESGEITVTPITTPTDSGNVDSGSQGSQGGEQGTVDTGEQGSESGNGGTVDTGEQNNPSGGNEGGSGETPSGGNEGGSEGGNGSGSGETPSGGNEGGTGSGETPTGGDNEGGSGETPSGGNEGGNEGGENPPAPTLYTVTLRAEGGECEFRGAGKYQAGDTVTVEALSIVKGYSWIGWYDGETKVSTLDQQSYTFTMPAEDKAFVAKMRLDPSALCVRVNEAGEKDIINGKYFLFGSYPQTLVTDQTLVSALNACPNPGMHSYNYYTNEGRVGSMGYSDITYNGVKYRKVFISTYRPQTANGPTPTAGESYQAQNGYTKQNTYWFKYEPIKWKILYLKNGEALILCESILDSQPYNKSEASKNGISANNYEYSAIRAWLNDDFYNTAFNDQEKQLIRLTVVDNDARSTNPIYDADAFDAGENPYAGGNTLDRIFLLSRQEVTSDSLGFAASETFCGSQACKVATDYARAQGIQVSSSGKGSFWLRSPNSSDPKQAGKVDPSGVAYRGESVINATSGVVPVLRVRYSGSTTEVDNGTPVPVRYRIRCTSEGLLEGNGLCSVYCARGESRTFRVVQKSEPTSDGAAQIIIPNGYEFVGWYEGGVLLGTSDSYTVTNPIENRNIVVKFRLKKEAQYVRINENGAESESGKYILFGSYPQTLVTDQTLVAALTSAARSNPHLVAYSYNYYSNDGNNGSMNYSDITYNGEKYRKVFISTYRPKTANGPTPTEENSYQARNGYTKQSVYWFKYEPIKWRILTEFDGNALILCDMILDSQPYNSAENLPNGVSVNLYEYSTIRSWLNDMFYKTAFDEQQRQIICNTVVDNGSRSTYEWYYAPYIGGNNPNGGAVLDRVFLLSMQELTYSQFGFNYMPVVDDSARRKYATDYAKGQGIYATSDQRSYWWTRSPWSTDMATAVGFSGIMDAHARVEVAFCGVAPALVIRLSDRLPEENACISIEYKVTNMIAGCNPSDMGGVVGDSDFYASGDTVTLVVRSDDLSDEGWLIPEGYKFLGWYEGDTKVSVGDSLTYTFTMPDYCKTFTAKFEKIQSQE